MEPLFYYISFSEYDLNSDGLIFRSVKSAKKFVKQALEDCDAPETYEEYKDGGFLTIEGVKVYED